MARSPPSAKPKPKSKPRSRLTTDPVEDVLAPALQVLFGKRLRDARIAAGLTQPQLGELCGMMPQYLSKVEKGQKNLTLSTMAKLAEAVGGRVGSMLSEPDESKVPPDE